MRTVRRLINWVALAVAVVSVVQELRKPAASRAWHGEIAGFIPYDWRIPTLARIRSTYWNPDNPHVLVPTLFGVGWSLNLYPLVGALRAA